MARVYVSSVIPATTDQVWDRIRDFNGLANWHPAMRESRIEDGRHKLSGNAVAPTGHAWGSLLCAVVG
jgi:hypothetical protein